MENTENLDNYKQTIYGKIAFGILVLFLLLGVHPYLFYREVPGEGLIPVSNNITWIIVSLFILFSTQHIVKRKVFINNTGINILLLTLIPLIIPLYYGNSELFIDGALRVLAVILGIITTMLVIQLQFSEKSWAIIFSFFLISVIGESIYGLYQYYIAPPGHHVMSPTSKINIPFGSFRQYNIMGTFVCTGIACSFISLKMLDNIKNSKSLSYSIQNHLVFLSLATIFLASWIAIICLSRTAYLALFFLFVLSILISIKSMISKNHVYYFFIAFIAGTSFGIVDIFTTSEHFRTSESLIESTGGGRIKIWTVTFNLLLKNLFFGIGYGDFYTEYLHQNAYHHANELPTFFGLISHPHNEFLYWGVEGGIVPLLGLAIGISAFTILAIQKKTSNIVFFIPLIPLAIHSQLELVFYSFSSIWILFCLLLAFACQQFFEPKVTYINNSLARITKIASITIPLFFVFILLLNLQAHYHYANYAIERNSRHLENIHWQGAFKYRIETNTLVTKAKKAIEEKDTLTLLAFSAWAKEQVKTNPREIIYRLHYEALILLNRKQEGLDVRQEAEYLFPKGEYFDQGQ